MHIRYREGLGSSLHEFVFASAVWTCKPRFAQKENEIATLDWTESGH
jgi:hypothetical protein